MAKLLERLMFWKPTALVVEDSDDIRKLVCELLGMHGFRTVSAPNGLEGVAAARKRRFDIIVMDISMPKVDGLQALEMMRGSPICRKTPILMMTAEKMVSSVNRAFELGANDYIGKPFAPAELLEKVRKLVPTA